MKVWLITVIIVFSLVELFQWIVGTILPFPLYVLGGAFLAIASNQEKGINTWFKKNSSPSDPLIQTATIIESIEVVEVEEVSFSPLENQPN